MKRTLSTNFLVTAMLAIVLAATASTGSQSVPKLKVVTTTTDLASLAREIGGDRVEVESLLRGNEDPHFAPSKASYLTKLRNADVFIVVGLALEGIWLTGSRHWPPLVSRSGNPRIQPGASGFFDASRYVDVLEIPMPPMMPNAFALGNPYYWLDPQNGRRIAQALADKFSQLQPNDASYFKDRFQAFSKRLSEGEGKWDAELAPYHGQKVVTYQRSWSYFLKRFQLVSIGEIEPAPGIPPARSNTRALIEKMKRENAKVILVEPYFETNTPKAIARATGAQVIVLPNTVGGTKGVSDYFELFNYDIGILATTLKQSR